MRTNVLVSLFYCLAVVFAGCGKRAAAPESQNSETKSSSPIQESQTAAFDVCGFIKNEEIEAIQGSPIKETKSSGHSGQGLHTAQCFYVAAEFSKSVNLSVTRRDPASQGKTNVKDYWKDTFGRNAEREKKREGDEEKKESLKEQRRERGEEEGKPLKKIEGIGDDAYWSATRVGGALYVLKKDSFIRISLGGADTDEVRIDKAKKLAAKALDRL
jgi:hypothetical protein